MFEADPETHSHGPLSDAGRWELVQRVAGSTPFLKSTRLREFLLFVCDRTLKNQTDDIREQQIGSTVFGRAVSYNPSEDNIVRVEARQLRKRLADYFAGEGQSEPWVITVPKGSYVPVFAPRELAQPELETAGADVIALPPPFPQEGTFSIPQPRFPAWYMNVALVIALVALIWLGYRNWHLGREVESAVGGAAAFPWSAVLDGEHQTNIVLADSCLALLQDVTGQPVSLSDYISRGYLKRLEKLTSNPELKSTLETLASRQYTSLADVSFVRRVMQFGHAYRERIFLSYARHMNIRDFKTNHLILLGTLRANPWVELFEPKLNFTFGVDESVRRGYFRNKAARKGEMPLYTAGGADGKSGESYAVVALVPNLNRTGNVLIIEGANMEGTEAAWEFLTAPDFASRALPRTVGTPDRDRQYFEVLLKLKAVGGGSKDTEAIAHRSIE